MTIEKSIGRKIPNGFFSGYFFIFSIALLFSHSSELRSSSTHPTNYLTHILPYATHPNTNQMPLGICPTRKRFVGGGGWGPGEGAEGESQRPSPFPWSQSRERMKI